MTCFIRICYFTFWESKHVIPVNNILKEEGRFIRRFVWTGIVILSAGLAFISLYLMLENIYGYYSSAKVYHEVEEIYENSYKSNSDSIPNELSNINSDYIGWIQINNSDINYPVVQGENNEFYLEHNFYKEDDFVGAIFMDYRNSLDELNSNTILYGHNMKDESMFGSLSKYLDPTYFDENNIISFDYLGHTYKWELFSVYNTKEIEWMMIQYRNKQDFHNFIYKINDNAIFYKDVNINQDDNLLTLVTCTTGEDTTERTVVHAKLIVE